MKKIVYTRFDGGVSVCTPTHEIMAWLACGGYWDHYPRGFAEVQIERQIADGRNPDAAARFVKALALGGCTDAEAYAIIRDRDCGHLGVHHELWDPEEVPNDRWFRDAWTRSANGGPIMISLAKARPIQWARMRRAAALEKERREADLDARPEIEVNWEALRHSVKHASCADDLRRIWPLGVSHENCL